MEVNASCREVLFFKIKMPGEHFPGHLLLTLETF